MFKTLSYLSIAVAMIFFSACTKDSPDPSNNSQTTLQKIQHRWVFDKEIDKGSGTGTVFVDTIKGLAGDYYEFNVNNKLYRQRRGINDTFNYSLSGNDKIIFSSQISLPDTFMIEVLTDNRFQFKNRISSAGFVNEATVYLTR